MTTIRMSIGVFFFLSWQDSDIYIETKHRSQERFFKKGGEKGRKERKTPGGLDITALVVWNVGKAVEL